MTLTLITTAASVVISNSDESPNWNGGDCDGTGGGSVAWDRAAMTSRSAAQLKRQLGQFAPVLSGLPQTGQFTGGVAGVIMANRKITLRVRGIPST